jgi:thioredoxin-related protein
MKKKLLSLLFLISFAFVSCAQDTTTLTYPNGFIYKIKLNGVDNFLKAKEIAFTLEEKFKFFPHFNDSSDCFEFYSNLNITQDAFKNDLKERGYAVDLFEQNLCAPCEIKEQEQ